MSLVGATFQLGWWSSTPLGSARNRSSRNESWVEELNLPHIPIPYPQLGTVRQRSAGADVILTGHDHVYERFAPQDPNGFADPNGLRAFVVGTGGKNHTTIPGIAPNSEVTEANTYGILKLTLHPTSYDWQFVPEPGKTFTDSGSQACH
jgi:hypothetical protein